MNPCLNSAGVHRTPPTKFLTRRHRSHVHDGAEALPTVDEIDAAVRQLNFSGSGCDGITARARKAVARDNDFFSTTW